MLSYLIIAHQLYHRMKRIKHIAFFKFKSTCTEQDIDLVWQTMESLPQNIPGILSLSWGVNISTESLDQGFTHSFVMVFENIEARDVYLPHPAHEAAKVIVVPMLESVIVLDHEYCESV